MLRLNDERVKIMTEKELIESCKKGDNKARKRLYEMYSQQMMGICFRYTGDRDVSQDLLHDGFIKVFMSIGSFHYRGEGSLTAWMSIVFRNIALEFLRKDSRFNKDIRIEDCTELYELAEDEHIQSIPEEILMKFISELPEGYRTVFNMYIFDEMSHKEIGECLGINESSSRSQLSRAKEILVKKIREYLKNHG